MDTSKLRPGHRSDSVTAATTYTLRSLARRDRQLDDEAVDVERQMRRLVHAFAHLCGAARLDASSGRQQRHRMNRGGDRQADGALHTVATVRISHDEHTKKYVARTPQ